MVSNALSSESKFLNTFLMLVITETVTFSSTIGIFIVKINSPNF